MSPLVWTTSRRGPGRRTDRGGASGLRRQWRGAAGDGFACARQVIGVASTGRVPVATSRCVGGLAAGRRCLGRTGAVGGSRGAWFSSAHRCRDVHASWRSGVPYGLRSRPTGWCRWHRRHALLDRTDSPVPGMKRTIRPNPTSWDLPLSGRSALRTGSRGQRRPHHHADRGRRADRRPPFDGLPAPASPSRTAYRSRRALRR